MKSALCASVSVAVICLATGTPVMAQNQPAAAADDASVVEEVVVSARKREERLRDVPIAATVLDESAIADQGGLRTIEDLIANAPAVHFLDTSSPVTAEVTIRGSGTSRGTNAEAAVGLYRNGAYVGGGALGGRAFTRWDLFDLERADTLRGTQGALFGRNAVGGAINVISQQPKFEREGQVFLQYGSKDYKQADLIYNLPLSENFAVRFSASGVDQAEGFFYNPSRDEYYDAQESDGQRIQFRYARDRFDGTLLLEHYRATLQSVTFQVVIPNGTSAAFPGGYIQDRYSYPHNGPGAAKQRLDAAFLTWNFDLGFAALESSTLYRVRRSLFAFDSDGVDATELARVRAANPGAALTTDPNGESATTDETTSFFQDLHLVGDIGERFNWLIGGEYLRLDSDSVLQTGRTPNAANGQSPGIVAPSAVKIRSRAVYGLAGYDFTERLNVTAEARYTADERSIAVTRFDRRTGLPVTPARFTVNGVNEPTNFNYTLSAGLKLSPEWLVYGKLGTAFRAGNFNTDLGDPRGTPIPVAYNDEEATTYELGLKGNLTPPLFIAVTGYRTLTKDALVQKDNGCRATNPVCPIAATNYLENGGELEVYGGELEFSYRAEVFGGRLRLNGGVSRQQGEFISGSDAGKEAARIPDWQIKGNVNYRHRLQGSLMAFVNLRYAGEWGGRQEINDDLPIPFSARTPTGVPTGALAPQLGPNLLDDHELVDLRIGVGQGDWEIALYANNALEEEYNVNVTATTNRPNVPRRVGVQFRYDF